MEETLLGSEDGAGASRTIEATADGTLPRGTSVGRYVVLTKVGAGGMGVVYAAYDPELDRKVAIKLLHPLPDGSAGDSQGRMRLLREAQSLAKLQHPEVLTVLDVGVHEGRIFAAMEFVDGLTLRAWLREQPRPWPEVLDVFLAAGRGLVAAHAKGLVHRDFKPDNVMIDLDAAGTRVERVRVTDFGLARAEPSSFGSIAVAELVEARSTVSGEDLTRTGAIMGTPAYMAPEQHLGRPADARTDQFSFCVALYEGLYGERPFAGMSYPELVASTTRGDLRPPAGGIRVPTWLREVVVHGLAVDPELRWPTMAELLDALRRDPTGRRRRVWAVVTVVAVGLGTWGALHVRERRRVAACEAASEAAAALWNDDARARVESGLRATGIRHAPETWERVRAGLDHRVGEWQQARLASCVDPSAVGADLVEIQDECFDSGLTGLAYRIELLSSPDAAILHRAIAIASDVDGGSACVDRERLARRMRLAPDADTRTRTAELRRQLDRVVTLQTAGAYDLALAEADAALTAAERLGVPDLAARAHVRRGRVLHVMSRFVEAERELEEGYFAALGVRDEETAWYAAVTLTALTGSNLARREDGVRWGRQAQALRALFGETDLALPGALERNLGLVALTAGNYDAAIDHLERARDLHTARLGEHSSEVINVLRGIGAALDSRGESDRAIENLSRALVLSEEAFGPDHPMVADANNDLGAAYIGGGREREGIPHLERAVAILEAAGLEEKAAGSYDNLSLALFTVGDTGRALALNQRALEIRERVLPAGHPSIANTLLNRGQMFVDLDRAAEAEPLYVRALAMYEAAFGPDHERVSDASFNLADVLTYMGELDRALVQSRRSLEIRRRVLPPDHPKVDEATAAALMGALATGQAASVLEELRRTVARVPKPPRPPRVQARLTAMLADALLETGDPTAALAASAGVELDALPPAERARALFTRARGSLATGGDRNAVIAQAAAAAAMLWTGKAADRRAATQIEAWLRDLDRQRSPPR